MSTHEVRYHGRLLGHFTEEEAKAYMQKRLSHPVEGKAFEPKKLTIEARRPVELYARGNLVDTFKSEAEAATARAELLEQMAEDADRFPQTIAESIKAENESAVEIVVPSKL